MSRLVPPPATPTVAQVRPCPRPRVKFAASVAAMPGRAGLICASAGRPSPPCRLRRPGRSTAFPPRRQALNHRKVPGAFTWPRLRSCTGDSHHRENGEEGWFDHGRPFGVPHCGYGDLRLSRCAALHERILRRLAEGPLARQPAPGQPAPPHWAAPRSPRARAVCGTAEWIIYCWVMACEATARCLPR